MTTSNSPQLLHQRYVQVRDLEALGQLFDQLAPKLLPIARRLNRSEHDAADALQETFLALVESRGHFDPERELIPWIVGILINKSRGASRRREFQVADESAAESTELHGVTPASEAPEEKLARFELGQALKSALDALPPALRAAVTGRLFQDESGPDVAAAEGISQGALRVRLFRGRELLQRALGPVAATWFGSLLLTSLGLPSTRKTLARLKRTTLQKAAGTTPKSATAAASRLAPKLLATAAVGAAALTVALNFMGDPSPQTGAVSVETAQVETTPNAASEPVATSDRTPEASVVPEATPAALTTFTARVLTLEGSQPLEGQVVHLTSGTTSNQASHEATTDSEGHATFELAPGTALRNIRALPSATTTSNLVWINRLPEGTDAIDLFVGLGASLSGTVLGPDDQPVPFAEVRVWCNERMLGNAPDRVVNANASGQFTLQHIGPKFIATAQTSDLACYQGLRGTLIEGRAESGAKLYLGEASTRNGLVLDPSGAPVEGASVVFRNSLSSSSSRDITSISNVFTFLAGSGETRTGPDGTFSVSGLPVTRTAFSVTKFPFKSASARFPQDSQERLTVQLLPAQSLRGVVVAPNGQPLEGVELSAWPFGGGSSQGGRATSDAHGAFSIEGLAFQEGTAATAPALIAEADGYAVSFTQPIEPNDQSLRVRMLPERALRGHIESGDLGTAKGLKLFIVSDHLIERNWLSDKSATWEGVTGTDKATTDANGDFAFTGLNVGPLRLFVAHPTQPRVQIEFAIGAAQERVDFTLHEADFPMTRLTGAITNALTGSPISAVTVSADWQRTSIPGSETEAAGRTYTPVAESDATGLFAAQGLPPGPLSIWISKKGYASVRTDLGILGAGTKTVNIALDPQRSLHVLLRDQLSGKGREGRLRLTDARGEMVMIGASGSSRSSAINSMGGEAFLHGLPAGPLQLAVTSSGTEVTVSVDTTQPNDEPLLVYLPTPAPPAPPAETVDLSWLFLEVTSPLTPEEAALFETPIDQAALRPWFLEQQKSGRIDTPQHTFRVTVEDATGEVFNSTTVTPTLHGEAPPTYTIEREGRTITRNITATISRKGSEIEMARVPSRSTLTTSARTIDDARAAFVNALPPVGRIRLHVKSEDYQPLTLDLDIKTDHTPGIGDMIFLTPK